jgi:hypothetical protein
LLSALSLLPEALLGAGVESPPLLLLIPVAGLPMSLFSALLSVFAASSRRHWSFSAPVIESQRGDCPYAAELPLSLAPCVDD